jgi:hypothetical protein
MSSGVFPWTPPPPLRSKVTTGPRPFSSTGSDLGQQWLNSNSTMLFIYLRLYSPLLGLGRFFGFLIFTKSVGLLGRGTSPSARPLPAHRTAQTQNKRTQTSMSWVGLEPTIPVFERAKTVHASDRGATVTGPMPFYSSKMWPYVYIGTELTSLGQRR